MTHTRSEIGKAKRQTLARADEIVRAYGPVAGADRIHSVTHDGRRVRDATDIRRVDRKVAPCLSGWRCRAAPP